MVLSLAPPALVEIPLSSCSPAGAIMTRTPQFLGFFGGDFFFRGSFWVFFAKLDKGGRLIREFLKWGFFRRAVLGEEKGIAFGLQYSWRLLLNLPSYHSGFFGHDK